MFFLKKNGPTPASFSTSITIHTTNKCEKCPSSIQRRDSNSQPSDHESPHLNPPKLLTQCYLKLNYIRTLVVPKWPILAVSA